MIEKIIDGRTDLVFEYVKDGNDPTSVDGNGVSLIRWCAYYGDVSAVKFLIRSGVSVEDLGSNFSLGTAAFHGHWQLCQYLLENGADPNSVDPENGETALHGALSKNRAVNRFLVEVLLAHGADPNTKTVPDQETGAFMRDVRTKGETPLHRAAAFADTETIEMLLEAGADKRSEDAAGDSPMSWASWHLRPGKILSLLAHGEHTIHPSHIERMQSDHGFGGPSGMELNLLGRVHIDD